MNGETRLRPVVEYLKKRGGTWYVISVGRAGLV